MFTDVTRGPEAADHNKRKYLHCWFKKPESWAGSWFVYHVSVQPAVRLILPAPYSLTGPTPDGKIHELKPCQHPFRQKYFTLTKSAHSYLVAISCISVAKPLDVVEDEPGKGDDHEHDEGYWDKHHRCPAHVLLQIACSYSDVQCDHNVLLQQGHNLTTFRSWDHDGYNITCSCKNTQSTGPD